MLRFLREVISVVKGNAYGHGGVAVSKFLQTNGCNKFAVATTTEGQQLRDAGITGTVLILSNITEYDIPTVYRNGMTPTIGNIHVLEQWKRHCENNKLFTEDEAETDRREVVLEVDTGLCRNGCTAESLVDIIKYCSIEDIPIHSILTHFSNAWDHDDSERQLEEFLDIVNKFRQEGIKVQAGSSGSIWNGIATELDYVRVGCLLYGIYPANDGKADVTYKPALSWYAKPNLVRDVKAGTAIGYKKSYICKSPQRLATLPVGFADGYPRKLSGNMCVTDLEGAIYPQIGTISMDAMTIRVGDTATTSDVFCLLSDVVRDANSCRGLASLTDTLMVDILANIGPRVHRLYEVNSQQICNI